MKLRNTQARPQLASDTALMANDLRLLLTLIGVLGTTILAAVYYSLYRSTVPQVTSSDIGLSDRLASKSDARLQGTAQLTRHDTKYLLFQLMVRDVRDPGTARHATCRQQIADGQWSDWSGTVVRHRVIGFVPNPTDLAPPMCCNSPAIIAETNRRARDVIGSEIKKGIDRLNASGKPYLFAGVIAGSETRMQDDSHPPVYYGYCALHNLGYSA